MHIRRAWAALCCVSFLATCSAHAKDVLALQSPVELQVNQRNQQDEANVTISDVIEGSAEIAADVPSDRVSKLIRIDRLRCEYRDQPLGIDHPAPRLGWSGVESKRECHLCGGCACFRPTLFLESQGLG
ncbi:MAG: hypothetical protein ACYSYL_02330 [Planctomycetota bacterium]